MITSPVFNGKRYAILGLARSGLAAAEALLASGAQITAWDRQDVARDKLAGRAEIADPLDIDLTGFDGVVVSPGVPLNTHPITSHAAKFGVPIIGDIELFALARANLPSHKVVGITGTNGKSTTTALVHHILKTAGMPTLMGGNIGIPIMEQPPLPDGGVYVLELSSYQIDLTVTLDCDVTALLNVTPDHLDRYIGFDAYLRSKERLFEMQAEDRVSIVGEAIWHYRKEVHDRWNARKNPRLWCRPNVSNHNPFDKEIGGSEFDPVTTQDDWLSLQGPHNFENAIAAIMICEALELSEKQIAIGLETFRGLPHRMEVLLEHNGVLFINDSKATNQASTAPALAAFSPDPDARVHWIVGGLAKEDGLGECATQLGNVAAAYTIGESGPRFAELLEGKVPVRNCELLCDATRRAVEAAKPGDVILLSPACASFDQFRDYEVRGEHFRKIVEMLTSPDSDGSLAA